jgi:hypothetical protein
MDPAASPGGRGPRSVARDLSVHDDDGHRNDHEFEDAEEEIRLEEGRPQAPFGTRLETAQTSQATGPVLAFRARIARFVGALVNAVLAGKYAFSGTCALRALKGRRGCKGLTTFLFSFSISNDSSERRARHG